MMTAEEWLDTNWRKNTYEGTAEAMEAYAAYRTKELVEALHLASSELHEMRLAQRHNNPPRNPEFTEIAENAVNVALGGKP